MKENRTGRRLARIFRPEARAEIEDELAFHIEQRIRDNMARGLDPETARAAAEERLGDLKPVQRECTELLTSERRAESRREWLQFSWLDFKLGFRMLAKYPGLTVVGGIAIAFAMALGAVSFELMLQVSRPSLPLPGGNRIVALRLWKTTIRRVDAAVLHDFQIWRAELKSVEHIGAFRTAERNLVGSDGLGLPVKGADITASAFRVARVAPLMGRTLDASDELPGAPPVIVLGESVWRTRFGSDPSVIGRAVRFGKEHHTVVGVMPKGFAFPMYHNVWTALHLDASGYAHGEGGGVAVFGRLAPGATMKRAQAELATLTARATTLPLAAHANLRAEVLPFTKSAFNAEDIAASFVANGFMLLFMLLLYANVALLMFARAATRESELVVRNALGASRGRILTQLFTEALVLGAVGAVVGLAFARLGVSWAFWMIDGNGVELPFWFHESLSPLTIVYAVGVTLLAAVVAGVIPGLKITRAIATQLRATSAGGGGQRFGGLWTGIIVTQVAFTVAFFPVLVSVGLQTTAARAVDLGVPAEEYLSLRLFQDLSDANPRAAPRELSASLEDLKRRVSAEPGVNGVTFAEQFPGGYHPRPAIQVEGLPPVVKSGVRLYAQRATVDLDFFNVMSGGVLSGRNFHSADLTSAAKVVVVNESFARVVLGDRNPIGKRLRYYESRVENGRQVEQPGPWFEVIGVVKDLAMWVDPDLPDRAGIYHPLSLNDAAVVRMAVRVGSNPERFAPRLRTIAMAVDPELRVADIEALNVFAGSYLVAITFWFRIMVFAGAIAMLLSLAGVYSVTAFTVSRRTREIGIRSALGAGRRGIMTALFSRTINQVGIGITVGVAVWVQFQLRDSPVTQFMGFAGGFAALIGYAAVMMTVCLFACIVPARRALRIQPTEALRADG